MGNCCGKESGNFSGEGRTLGAAPATVPPRSNIARAPAPKVGQTLGGSNPTGDSSDPKSAAARAAEERAKAAQASQGKLGKALAAQKSQSNTDALAQAARDNVAARDANAAFERQNYN